MKRLLEIIVAREEGYTRRERTNGGMFVAVVIIICLVAEIINAL